MSEKNETKEITVTGYDGREKTYTADGYTMTDGALFVNLHGATQAAYPADAWMAFRRDGSIASETKALDIARRALEAITRISDPNVAIKLADDALGEIFAETDL